MIYLTVGTYPGGFDRLVSEIDSICGEHNIQCIAQIGNTTLKPNNIEYKSFFAEKQHLNNIEKANLIITHGGFGIIGDIMRKRKPMIIAPRGHGEGPNDQLEMTKQISIIHSIDLCLDIIHIESLLLKRINNTNSISYNFKNNVSSIISKYLKEI